MAEMQSPAADYDETDARRVLLIQAVEATDQRGKLISDAEREQAERIVLARRGVGEQGPPDAAWFVAARAAELLHTVESRSPALARLETRDPWAERLGWLLPALALVAGFSSDRLFNWSRTDLLSLPLLGVVVWNLVTYAVLAAAAVSKRPPTGLLRGLTEFPSWFSRGAAARLRESAGLQFRLLWWRVAGAMESARLYKTLHLSAIAWAVGVVMSIVITGLALKFRVGWESTWLAAEHVHKVLELMAMPARALGLDGFTVEQVRQLEFTAGRAYDQDAARRWALIYIAFLTATVILPRLALWALAKYRVHALGKRVRLDLGGDYFAGVLARVTPAHMVVGVRGEDARLVQSVLNLLAQAGEGPASAGQAIIATAQGDRLELESLGKASDVVLLAVAGGKATTNEEQALADVPLGTKILVLCPREEDAAGLRGQLGLDVMPLPGCGACWALERPLHQWLHDNSGKNRRPGVDRLVSAWQLHHQGRFNASMALLGQVLAQSVSDEEKVRGWLPGAKGHEAATVALRERMQARLDRLHDELVRIHAVQSSAVRHLVERDRGLPLVIGQAGAGAAGAVAGALAGAKIDLLTGGLSMGAGIAMGALLGGAGLFTAAGWWLLGGTVRLGDEQVQGLTELLVMQYLAIIHSGRVCDQQDGRIPPGWNSETVAAVAAAADEYKRAAKGARSEKSDQPEAMTGLMKRTVWQVLGRLYGSDKLPALT